jgi:hypothetical protein
MSRLFRGTILYCPCWPMTVLMVGTLATLTSTDSVELFRRRPVFRSRQPGRCSFSALAALASPDGAGLAKPHWSPKLTTQVGFLGGRDQRSRLQPAPSSQNAIGSNALCRPRGQTYVSRPRSSEPRWEAQPQAGPVKSSAKTRPVLGSQPYLAPQIFLYWSRYPLSGSNTFFGPPS